jgi:methylthioribose-1-phosphate isomerase
VAAPTTTIDPNSATGDDITIEEREQAEVLYTTGVLDTGEVARVRTAAPGTTVRNPAFDVTPAHLVTGIITEFGIVPATPEGIASVARTQPPPPNW